MSGDDASVDGDAIVERVREECGTELDRLGSEKALVATTDAVLESERVLARTAGAAARAAATYGAWADDESVEAARAAFEETAAAERESVDRLVALGAADPGDPEPDPLHDYLRGLDDSVERAAGGLVGRPLVISRSLLQVVNFFVNEADREEADFARELRSAADAHLDAGATLLETLCNPDDEERAVTAAIEAVEAAYREYAETLEAMGVDPKPVC
jgi:hypothetical protein